MGTWTEPIFTRNQVDKAGKILGSNDATEEQRFHALEVLGNWRASHSFPMNTLQVGLRTTARKICPTSIVAQRLKRASSIIAKLERYPEMSLKKMQDIAGCRVIVEKVDDAYRLFDHYRSGTIKHLHELQSNVKDYIATPKEDGYRSIHLVYKFKSNSSKTSIYNGHLVEIQIRSKVQHAWATALETVDTMNQSSLKLGKNDTSWGRFFILVSEMFSIGERTADHEVLGRLTSTMNELTVLYQTLNVADKLKAFSVLFNPPEHIRSAEYYLLLMDPTKRAISVVTYKAHQIDEANFDYLREEVRLRDYPSAQVVLVAAGSVKALKEAYPNYYADTHLFLELVGKLVSKHAEKRN